MKGLILRDLLSTWAVIQAADPKNRFWFPFDKAYVFWQREAQK